MAQGRVPTGVLVESALVRFDCSNVLMYMGQKPQPLSTALSKFRLPLRSSPPLLSNLREAPRPSWGSISFSGDCAPSSSFFTNY